MKYKNLDKTEAYQRLLTLQPKDLATVLDAQRIKAYQVAAAGGLTYNYAAMPVDRQSLAVLQELADEQQLIEKYRAVLNGEIMNTGEKRLVLHHLTRGQVLGPVVADGEDKGSFYAKELKRIEAFATKVRNAKITGSTGKPFKTVVQIGIGGSDLGPRALYLALKGWCTAQNIPLLDARFISNVDPDDAAEVLRGMDFETTLFILVSKSGTTLETLTNRDLVLKAITESGIQGIDAEKHMAAVTSKTSP
ncbi:MAG: glucose-6-phosphate isomerase, partial [Spirochaetia bacterium]|nr:glucose-6-phosphate isomerase [Spirochaetia bacterium]